MLGYLLRGAFAVLLMAASASAQDIVIWIGGEPYPAHLNSDGSFEWLQSEPDGWDDNDATWNEQGNDYVIHFVEDRDMTLQGPEEGEVLNEHQIAIGYWEEIPL